MTRNTKFDAAVQLALDHHINVPNHREHLYHELNRAGYFWRSTVQQWEFYGIPETQPPYDPIRIHLWARADRVTPIVEIILDQLRPVGIKLISRTESIPCNHPEDFYNLVVMRLMAKFEDD